MYKKIRRSHQEKNQRRHVDELEMKSNSNFSSSLQQYTGSLPSKISSTKIIKMNSRLLMGKDSVFQLNKELWDDTKEYGEDYKSIIKLREERRIPFIHQSPQVSKI